MSTYQTLDSLKDREETKNEEICLLVKVLKVFEKDEQTLEVRIKDDSNQLWFLTLPKLRFGGNINIREGEIIRVRSVTKDSRNKHINSKLSTNILKFLPCAKIVRLMQTKIKELPEEDKMLLEDESEVIMKPINLTDVDDFERNQYHLQLLYLNYDEGISKAQKQLNKFFVRL